MKVRGAKFRYQNGNVTGTFVAFGIVDECLFGHITFDGDHRQRDWLAWPDNLLPPVRIKKKLTLVSK